MEKFINSFFGKHYVPHSSTVVIAEVTEVQQPKKVKKVKHYKENSKTDKLNTLMAAVKNITGATKKELSYVPYKKNDKNREPLKYFIRIAYEDLNCTYRQIAKFLSISYQRVAYANNNHDFLMGVETLKKIIKEYHVLAAIQISMEKV